MLYSLKFKYGNLYATCSFNGTGYIKTPNGSSTTKTGGGTMVGMLAKFTPNGTLVWSNTVESSTTKIEFHDVNVASNGDIYAVGMFFGTATIKGQNSTTKTTTSSSGVEDAMWMKFNNKGEILWVKEAKSVGDDISGFISIDNKDNVFISHQVGCCAANNVNFGWFTFTNSTSWGTVITKIDTANGSPVWYSGIPGEAIINGGLACDASGNLYAVGHYSGSKTISGGTVSKTISTNGAWDCYVAKFNTYGDLLWVKSFGGTGNDYGNRCVFRDGKLYFTLTYSNSYTINTGSSSVSLTNSGGTDDAIIVFDTLGNVLNAFQFKGAGNSRALAIDYATSGKLLIGGSFNGSMTYGSKTISASGSFDNAYIFTLDSPSTSRFIQYRNYSICNGTDTTIRTGLTSGTFSWTPGTLLVDSTVANPITKCTSNTTYILKYTTPEGCVFYDTTTITFKSCTPCISSCNTTSGGNLMTNADFSSGNTGFSASPYTYFTASPMTQGEYCITASPSSIHFAYSGVDHTSGSGKMMVINGSNMLRGKFYTQIVNVQPSTCYKVGVWVNNIVSASYTGTPDAYVRFNLNKDSSFPVLRIVQFPDQWVNMETTWYSDTCTKLYYVLEDTSTSGNGNDFAIDDVYVLKCACTTTWDNSAGPDTSLCLGSSYTLPVPSGNQWIYNILAGDSSSLSGGNIITPSKTTRLLLKDTSGSCAKYDTVLVTVNPPPTLAVADTINICFGDTFAFNNTSTATAFTWSPAAAISATNILNPKIYPAANTWYYISASTGGCSKKDSVFANIIKVSAQANPDTAVCVGSSFKLRIISSGAGFRWLNPDAPADSTNAAPTISPTVSKNYILQSYSGACSSYDTASIIVNPLPTINLGADLQICNGDSVKINAVSNAARFKWNPAIFLSLDTILQPYAKCTVNTNYIVTATSAGGCKNSDTININVSAITAIAKPDTGICQGDSVSLRISFGTGSFVWLNPDNLADSMNPPPVVKPNASKNYILIVTNGVCTRFDTASIQVSTPTSVNAGPDQTLCQGDSVKLNATSGGNTFSWSPATDLSNPNILNPFIKPTAPSRTYILTASTNGACANSDTVEVFMTSVTAVAGPDTTLCNGDSIQLYAISGAPVVHWLTYDHIEDTASSFPWVKPIVSKQYILEAMNGNCRAWDTASVNVGNPGQPNAGPDKTICKGDTLYIKVKGTNAGILWSPNYMLSSDTAVNVKIYTDQDTTYIIQAASGSCKANDTLHVTVKLTPIADAGPDIYLCKYDTGYMAGHTTNADYIKWTPVAGLANDSDTLTAVKPAAKTIYTLTAYNSGGCKATDQVTVDVSAIKASFKMDKASGFIPLPVHFTYTGSFASGYIWNFGDTLGTSTAKDPDYTFTKSGKHQIILVINDGQGCFDTAYGAVSPLFHNYFYIPNAFSPNKNKINDVFNIGFDPNGYLSIQGWIFDRWGEKIYEMSWPGDLSWDGTYRGKQVPDGVYLYRFVTVDIDKDEKVYQGTITVIH